jgi:nodulation protein E
MGVISALGHSAAANWEALREGRSGIAPIANIPTDLLNIKIAAEVRGFDPAAHFEHKRLPLLDRVSQLALVAAREAVAQSGLDFRAGNRGERTACIIGSGIGGETTHNEQSKRFYGDKNPRVHPLSIVRVMANAPACHVGIEFGLTGPAFAVVSACASANHAMAQAFDMVRSGKVDFAVTGGSEACVTEPIMKAWEAMRVTADDTCRPFCKQRRGMVLGEGAGIFVLEEYERARRRGADILAEFAGSGMTADAGDMVFPSEVTIARAMQHALADAALAADAVGYINAHGTGTPANDPTESKAIRRVFATHADKLAVSSTKSMHGHALGAAGAIELIAVIGALRHGIIPPTANFLDPDPECDLDYVPNTARERKLHAALSNSFAFGGLNAVVALKQAD